MSNVKVGAIGWLGCLVLAGLALSCGGDAQPLAQPIDYNGIRNSPAHPLPDIELTDTNGQPFNIRDRSNGYLTLVYMGFTHCESECPTEMARIAFILREMPKDASEKVRVIFITTDPERDTPEALRGFLDNFNRDFIGLTGSRELINAVQTQLGANPASVLSTGAHDTEGHDAYTMDHTTFLLVFPQNDGHAHLAYSSGMPAAALEADLIRLASQGWTGGE